jgi:hypothetical protein
MTKQDIKLGEGITIHKIDTVLSFGAPFQLFTYRAGYFAMNAALGAANLNFDFGLSEEGPALNISDFTIFVPTDEAFKSIGSVLETADLTTLQEVLKYHIIPSNVIFSPSLGNVTVPSLQGTDLVFTVLPDGSAWVNGAKITFANTILFNGVAHVIDAVLAPGAFDRASLQPSAPAASRLAFPDATSVSQLPFSSVSFAFGTDVGSYTSTPVLLQTVAAVAVATGAPNTTTTTTSGLPAYTGAAAGKALPSAIAALAGAAGFAAALL